MEGNGLEGEGVKGCAGRAKGGTGGSEFSGDQMLDANKNRMRLIQENSTSIESPHRGGGAGGFSTGRDGPGAASGGVGGDQRDGVGGGGNGGDKGADGGSAAEGQADLDEEELGSPMPRRVQRGQHSSNAGEQEFELPHDKVTKKLAGQILILKAQMNASKASTSEFSATHVLRETGFKVEDLRTFQVANIHVTRRILDFWCSRSGSDMPKARACINSGLFSMALALMVTFSGEFELCV